MKATYVENMTDYHETIRSLFAIMQQANLGCDVDAKESWQRDFDARQSADPQLNGVYGHCHSALVEIAGAPIVEFWAETGGEIRLELADRNCMMDVIAKISDEEQDVDAYECVNLLYLKWSETLQGQPFHNLLWQVLVNENVRDERFRRVFMVRTDDDCSLAIACEEGGYLPTGCTLKGIGEVAARNLIRDLNVACFQIDDEDTVLGIIGNSMRGYQK